ncbi:MAG: M55 family metallopeptidase [Gammaproteobacteria bacterium]|nr:M55 family metallopeptidase [Gammaproteobacteria bacterium]
MVVRLALMFGISQLAVSCPTHAQDQFDGAHVQRMPAKSDGGKIRVLLYYDMEGLSGQTDWRSIIWRFEEPYTLGRDLLVNDVNAVLDGLFSGGATEVDVVDAHGSGNVEPDLPPRRLDPRARHILRDTPFEPYMDLVQAGAYDAVVAVGMHTKTGGKGFAAHTWTPGIGISLNGRPVNETEFLAYSWGRVGVPVILVSGDDRLGKELDTMPWLEYVTVKETASASSVKVRPVEAVHREMREFAQRAIRSLPRMKAMVLPTPIQVAVSAFPPNSLESLKDVPGVDYADDRVTFTAKDLDAAYRGIEGLVGVASSARLELLIGRLRERPDSAAIFRQFWEDLGERWLGYESDTWRPAKPTQPAPSGRMYGGSE